MPNNGTLVNSPTFVTSASGFGQTLTFDGSSQYVNIGNALQVAQGGSFSVRLRLKTTATGSNQVVVGSDHSCWVGLNNGIPKAQVYESSDGSTSLNLNGSTSVADGNWHELELNVTTANAYLFADGALVASSACSYVPITINDANPCMIGAYPNSPTAASNYFPGTVDEVSIWSTPQHTASYTVSSSPVSNTAANLVNLYHFDGNANDSATPPFANLTPTAATFWDNGYSGTIGGAIQTSEFGRLVVNTDATSVTVNGYSDMYSDYPPTANIGVRVNGTTETTLAFSANTGSFTVSLPGVSGTTVEFVNGNQQVYSSGSGWYGSYVSSLAFSGGTTATFVTPAPTNTLLVYGDSIEGGGPNANVPFGAWTELMRATWAGDVMIEAYGGRTLYDDCSTSAATTTFAARLAAYSPSKLIMCIGVNDYSNGQWSLSAFTSAYGSLLDQFHALAPAVPVVVVAPLLTTSREGANSAGVMMDQYRSAITGLATTRPWLMAVNAKSVLTSGLLNSSDGVHPTVAGQADLSYYYLGVAGMAAVRGGLSTTDVNNVVNGILAATPPTLTGKATTFGQQVNQLHRRFFGPSALTETTLTTYQDNGTTVITQQALSDNGTTQTVGSA